MLSPPFAVVTGEVTIVTEDEEVLEGSAELVAVTATVGCEGIADGAV
jgi:F0F1-type ATP synthase epsilon subunit